jgi:hypothetical protein
MELINPPSRKSNSKAPAILLACGVLLALVFLGMYVIWQGQSQTPPVAVDKVLAAAPRPEPQAAPPPSAPKLEQTPAAEPEPIAPEPAPAAEPVAQPSLAAMLKAQAAPAPKPVPRLKVTRHLSEMPSRTAAVYQPPVIDSPAAPAVAQEPAPGPQPQGEEVAAQAAPVASAGYGAAGRTQIMGQAAGPVYNLRGRGLKSAAPAPRRSMGQASEAKAQDQATPDASEESAPEE